jgi:hypothetical protein
MAFLKSGSPGGTRTPDQLVNSQLLYRLSYRGNNVFSLFTASALGYPPLYRLDELQLKADQPKAEPGKYFS